MKRGDRSTWQSRRWRWSLEGTWWRWWRWRDRRNDEDDGGAGFDQPKTTTLLHLFPKPSKASKTKLNRKRK
jgi:hypothetical protein